MGSFGLVEDQSCRCILNHHRQFLRFAFEGVAYQYKILPFGLSLAPRTFIQYMDAALSPLRQDGNPHPQLPPRLAHSCPVRGSFNIAQDPPPQQLILPVAQGQLCQEHTVTQPTSIIPGHSYQLSADDRNCLSGVSHDDLAPCGFLQGRDRPSAQSFSKNAGPYGSSFTSTSVGSALHVTHPVLAEVEGSIHSLASWTPPHNGDSGLCISPGPLEGPPLVEAGYNLRHSAQKEGCHDRHFQQGLRSTVRGQTDLRSLVRRGVGSAHQMPRAWLAVCHAYQFFLPDIRGHYVLVCSISRYVVSYINHQCMVIIPLLLAGRWAGIVQWSSFYEVPGKLTPHIFVQFHLGTYQSY